MAPSTHSSLGASSAYRWLACPASPRLCANALKKTSEYADQGTVAHELAEICLRRKHDAAEYLTWFGWVNQQGAAGITRELGQGSEGARYRCQIDREMVEAVQVYLNEVRATWAFGGDLIVEHRFDLKWLFEEGFGTNDALVAKAFKKLTVFDYKHGAGVAVEVENNPQLLYYALGALGETNFMEYGEIQMVIVQPRAPHRDGAVRRSRIWTPEELYSWAREVLLPGVMKTKDPNAQLVAGDHCRFCDAKVHCPAIKAQANEIAMNAFSEIGPVDLPGPAELSKDEVLRVLEVGDRVTAWIKEVNAFAQHLLERGEEIPGYKLVAKRATRQWIDEAAVQARVMNYRDAAYDLKLKSPAQMSKMIQDSGQDPVIVLAGLIETKSSGLTMVKNSDQRTAVEVDPLAGFAAQEKVPPSNVFYDDQNTASTDWLN